MKRLLLLGGGHAQLAVLESLVREPMAGVEATLVTPSERAVYSGMLPGWVAGHYALPACTIDLSALARAAGVALKLSAAIAIDAGSRRVRFEDGSEAPYDFLCLDIGSMPAAMQVPGATERAVPVRPLVNFIAGWKRVLEAAQAGEAREVSVVGGGAAGVELALAMAQRFRREAIATTPHVRILTEEAQVLSRYPALARRWVRKRLDAAGIGVHERSPVREVGGGFIRVGDSLTFSNDATFWVTGPAAPALLRESGLQVDAAGFVAVNECQQSLSHPNVFAAGDCATRSGGALPKSGVYAVRAGPALAENLRAAIAGGPLKAHRPAERHLALLATGDGAAVGAWGGLSFAGRWVWRWKDRIDRAFIARYSTTGRPA